LDRPESSPSRGFFLVGLVGALAFSAACVVVATQQWFVGDDFSFLSHVQRPGTDWWAIFFSPSDRFWWSYRPIGMDSYFAIGHALFGLSYMGFFAISFAFHLATVALAHRIARLLGMGAHGAMVVGLVYLTRYAIVDGIFWCSDFFYVSASFFYALAVCLFLEFLASGSRSKQALSAACFVAALMSCEFALTLPAVLLLLGLRHHMKAEEGVWLPSPAEVARIGVALWPHWLAAAIYVPFRYLVATSTIRHGLYSYSISGKSLDQALAQIAWISGPGLAAWASALLILGSVGWVLRRSAEQRGEAVRYGLPLAAVFGAWLVANGLPFIGLVHPHSRFSMPLVLPAALFAGLCVHLVFQNTSASRRPLLEVAVLAGIALSLPYAALTRHAAEPASRPAWIFAETVAALPHAARFDRKMAVTYGGPEMAGAQVAEIFGIAVQNGALLPAVFPGQNVRFELAPVGSDALGPARCPKCEYFQLMPDYTLLPWEGPSALRPGPAAQSVAAAWTQSIQSR
jgi:hypothetical protein